VAAAHDQRGRLLGTCAIPTTPTGFVELLRWAAEYGELAYVVLRAPEAMERAWLDGYGLET
jgi:hypothetical protein